MSCFFRERRPDTRTMLTRPLNQNLAQFVPNHIMFAIQPQHQAETILRPFVFPGTQGIGATLSNGWKIFSRSLEALRHQDRNYGEAILRATSREDLAHHCHWRFRIQRVLIE